MEAFKDTLPIVCNGKRRPFREVKTEANIWEAEHVVNTPGDYSIFIRTVESDDATVHPRCNTKKLRRIHLVTSNINTSLTEHLRSYDNFTWLLRKL